MEVLASGSSALTVLSCASVAGSRLEAAMTSASWALEPSFTSIFIMVVLALMFSRQQSTYCVELR